MKNEPSNFNPASSEKLLAVWLSLIIGTFLMILKFLAHYLTGSESILSDALESIVNVIAAGFGVFVIHFASQPVDQDHPYGHGKMEFFSSAFEGGLISFAGVFIIIESIRSLWMGEPLEKLDQGLFILLFTGCINALLGWYLVRTGKRTESLVLKASGHHVLTDVGTTLALFLGLVFVRFTQISWLDGIFALIAAGLLLYTGWGLLKESSSHLMDAEDITLLERVKDAFQRTSGNGIVQIHGVKIIRSGNYHHIDAHLVVAEFWKIHELHDQVKVFEKLFMKDYGSQGEMNFHFDPCRRAYCRECSLLTCPIREVPYHGSRDITLEELRSKQEILKN